DARTEAPPRTADAAIAPSCVLWRETDDERLDCASQRWTAGPAMRVCLAARHQPLVPAQQRSRTDGKGRPGRARQRSTQRRQEHPIRLLELRPPRLPAPAGGLMPQAKDP